jgi:hypothetical protein
MKQGGVIKMNKMKCLSIKQPWANLIISGIKSIEIRTWKTSYKGQLFIHTGKVIDQDAKILFPKTSTEPTGALIGIVKLVEIKIYDTPELFNQDYKLHLNPMDYYYGKTLYGWKFSNIQPIKPILYPGALNLFYINISDKIIEYL